ncbi:MAG: hypothetical protein M3Q23_18350 [Actinomycetota bacterium]|nr:hypothetical protein [Actinomycetota bacterium]
MPCARCDREPDADLIRWSEQDSKEELASFMLCPECSYGLNTLLAAYVANRDAAPAPS